MRRPLAALLLASGVGVAAHAAPRRIVYGGDSTAPPYESLDPAGQPQGFNVELVRALAKKTGFELTIRLGSWPQILQAFEAGEIDLVSIAYTDARAARYDM